MPNTILNSIGDLPVLSPVVRCIGQVIQNADSSVDDIVEVLKLDSVIAGKILKLANSAYVGIPRTVSSIKNAVVLLGQKRIHSLVLASSVLSKLHASNPFPFTLFKYWKHSTTTAAIAEAIARNLKRYDPIESEDVFSAALLHDIGKLLLATSVPEVITAASVKSRTLKTPFYKSEELSLDHGSVGGLLCEHWNLPESLQHAVAYHHDPAKSLEHRRLISIVHVSDIMTHIIGLSIFDHEMIPEFLDEAVDEVKLSPERLRVIADDALKNEKKLEAFIHFLI